MKTVGTIGAVLVLAGAAVLSGCATVYEGKFQFPEGWRVAQVVRVTQGSLVEHPAFGAAEPVGGHASARHVAIEQIDPNGGLRRRRADDVGAEMIGNCPVAGIRGRACGATRVPPASRPPGKKSGAQKTDSIEELLRWIS